MKNFTFNSKNLLIVIQNCKLILLFITVSSYHAEARCLSNKTVITVESHRIWLNVTSTSGAYSQTLYGYHTGATNGYDSGVDAAYINNGTLALTSFINDTRYAIQMKGLPFAGYDTVPLSLSVAYSGKYTFSIDHVDGLFLNVNQPIYLHDILKNTYTNLKTDNYIFDCQSGTYNNRFKLTYTVPNSPPPPPGVDLLKSNNFTVFSLEINHDDTFITVKSGNIRLQSIEMHSLNGQLLYKNNAVFNNIVMIPIHNVCQQTMIIRGVSEDGSITVKNASF